MSAVYKTLVELIVDMINTYIYYVITKLMVTLFGNVGKFVPKFEKRKEKKKIYE